MTQLDESFGGELEFRAREGIGAPADASTARAKAMRRNNRASAIATGFILLLACLMAWKMWNAYMVAPWTRDATVRAYVITEVPEVSGQIVHLAVRADQHVHKGDLLLEIDPTNYEIAVSNAEAAVAQARADADNRQAQAARRLKLTTLSTSVEEQQSFVAQAHVAEAVYQQDLARLKQAHINLKRTRIVSPVNGYVTNLTAQVGDYATAGRRVLTVVNTDSFWVEGYFEETQLEGIHLGDPVQMSLMGHSGLLQGHVEGISRGIEVANAQSGDAGLASVNPVYVDSSRPTCASADLDRRSAARLHPGRWVNGDRACWKSGSHIGRP
ncbi:MAG TPA: HlyD family secretion protein [Steroidobacteraceae bacterium]